MRRPDWEQRLHDYLAAHADAVFEYGRIDCALFVAGAVEVQTGVDFAAPFRGKYITAVGSLRALRRYGAGTLEATISVALPERGIGFARRGDVVMMDGIAGVCIGADGVFVGEEGGMPGLVRYQRATWTACWGVG